MNHRPDIAPCLMAAGLILLGACNLKKTDAEPAPSATATAAAEAPPSAQPAADSPQKTGSGADKPSSAPAAAGPTTTLTKNEREVKTDGKDLKLKNETGKGSVSTSGGSTTITGKDGKSVKLPGL